MRALCAASQEELHPTAAGRCPVMAAWVGLVGRCARPAGRSCTPLAPMGLVYDMAGWAGLGGGWPSCARCARPARRSCTPLAPARAHLKASRGAWDVLCMAWSRINNHPFASPSPLDARRRAPARGPAAARGGVRHPQRGPHPPGVGPPVDAGGAAPRVRRLPHRWAPTRLRAGRLGSLVARLDAAAVCAVDATAGCRASQQSHPSHPHPHRHQRLQTRTSPCTPWTRCASWRPSCWRAPSWRGSPTRRAPGRWHRAARCLGQGRSAAGAAPSLCPAARPHCRLADALSLPRLVALALQGEALRPFAAVLRHSGAWEAGAGPAQPVPLHTACALLVSPPNRTPG